MAKGFACGWSGSLRQSQDLTPAFPLPSLEPDPSLWLAGLAVGGAAAWKGIRGEEEKTALVLLDSAPPLSGFVL